MLFVHSGPAEQAPPRTIELRWLAPDDTEAVCSRADAAILDVGCLLSHDGEIVQVTNLTLHTSVGLVRGWNGTPRKPHPTCQWIIEIAPRSELDSRPSTWNSLAGCITCGAPGQIKGQRCRYCARVVGQK